VHSCTCRPQLSCQKYCCLSACINGIDVCCHEHRSSFSLELETTGLPILNRYPAHILTEAAIALHHTHLATINECDYMHCHYKDGPLLQCARIQSSRLRGKQTGPRARSLLMSWRSLWMLPRPCCKTPTLTSLGVGPLFSTPSTALESTRAPSSLTKRGSDFSQGWAGLQQCRSPCLATLRTCTG
jgi:hypothetical protein